MACPTCDHTMQNILPAGLKALSRVFWCPRCGTVKIVTAVITPQGVGYEEDDILVPKRELETSDAQP